MAVAVCDNLEILRKQQLPVAIFSSEHLQKGIPVVLENCIDQWPARKWTFEELSQKAGHNTVNVRINTDCADYREGRKYAIRQTSLAAYLADLVQGNARARNSYLAVQNIKKALPELCEDVIVPQYVGKMHGGPFLWIAPHCHYEYCHFDPDDGLLAVLAGTKRVRLFGCDLAPLYPNPLGSKGRTVQATVNCESPDLELHPLFKGTRCYHTVLHPGDMLYIPAFWWHQVTSYDDAISVNMFFGDGGENVFTTKVLQPPQWGACAQWLCNVIEQNRHLPSFTRVLARLPEALGNFLMTQWHETPSRAQLAKFVTLVMTHLGVDTLPTDDSMSKHPPALQIRGLLWRS